jgi:23S rRNA pseudouridine1911/1915/1917 synthase
VGRRRPALEAEALPEPRIVFSDEWLAVIEKPAGLIVHPAPGHHGPTLVSVLGDLLGGGEPERPGIVHRLDRDTSGLMIVARAERSHQELSKAIHDHLVEREYLALVEGRPRSRKGTIDAPLGRDFKQPDRRTVGGRGAREARTHFEVVEPLRHESLVRARLETGRTHQIRAHFKAIGHPVAGDPQYGSRGRLGLRRQFLHSAALAFEHPVTGERLEYASELPPDLVAALEKAREAR